MEKALEEDQSSYEDGDVALRSIFLNILELKDLDIRDKKSAIIDFIAAGIETVTWQYTASARLIPIFSAFSNS